MSNQRKVERSIVMSARIDLVDLATLDKFWESQGVKINSMSQLISWSLSALVDVLVDNEKVEKMHLVDAHERLVERNLYQRSNLNRVKKRIATAIRLDSLRERGLDPAVEDSVSYNTIHRKGSNVVNAYPEKHSPQLERVTKSFTDDEWDEIMAKARADREREIAESIESAKGNESLLIAPKDGEEGG